MIVSNPKVWALYGERVRVGFSKAGFKTELWLMKDGERYKSLRSAEELLSAASRLGLTRSDLVVALGGGVVGDLAGFASAVYLRGIPFLQIPTTLLAMIDSSVGGKTGVNTAFGKNLVGAFHDPSGVLVDTAVLATLDAREITAGLCEAVKHAMLSGGKLFERTSQFLSRHEVADFNRQNGQTHFSKELVGLIADQISFKASVVRGDAKEGVGRSDRRSRKILNLGHTVGHALEKTTNFRRLRHGEAVGYGLRAAVELSKNLEILPVDELESLNDVLHRIGKLPRLPNIKPKEIVDAIAFDKKSVNGAVQWILLEAIGKPIIIPSNEIPKSAITHAVKSILQN